jgi:hypothetical protein
VARWSDIENNEPELARLVRARFECHPHHVLGTVRADGSPRLSGINVFFSDGHLWWGSMTGARKAVDVRRDQRVALYSAPLHEDMTGGDASISGLVIPIDGDMVRQWKPETPADGEFFEVDVTRLHLVEVVDDELVISMWDKANGLRIVKRQ